MDGGGGVDGGVVWMVGAGVGARGGGRAAAVSLSYPGWKMAAMELCPGLFACERCACEFVPKARGRRPLYCSHTCRQRAYEARRRAAFHQRLLTPSLAFPPSAPPSSPYLVRPKPRYEAGRHRQVVHALRPDGAANGSGHRPTLCGAITRPDAARRFFGDARIQRPSCEVCADVARRFPLTQAIDPPADLSRVKHLLAGGRSALLTGNATAQEHLLDELYRLTA